MKRREKMEKGKNEGREEGEREAAKGGTERGRNGEMEEEKKTFTWSHRSQENPAIHDEV